MTVLRFGRFELDIAHRSLSESGKILHLGGRAFDILAVLVARAGQIISKDELIKAVWTTTTVDEGALRVHMVTLRKLLGDREAGRYIENIPGRGYAFVMPVQSVEDGESSSDVQPVAVPKANISSNLPRLAGRLIGRETFVEETARLVASNRLVTIAGAGGIGKTSVALAVGEILSESRPVLFVDLAALTDGRLIMPTLASLLGVPVFSDDAEPGVLRALEDSNVLLVFDNCEHLILEAASSTEDILTATPNVSILATSREPLRVSGERIRQLPSLVIPPEDVTNADWSSFSAMELLIDRMMLSSDVESFDRPEDFETAASIVRRLDGIPLAIEFAASRVAHLGLVNLANSLDDPLTVLRRGRRTAPPRQQTLRATLDWSFDSLTPTEKTLFEYVAVFAGSFSSDAALSVSGGRLSEDDFYEAFDGLFLKSFLSVSAGDGSYRLLETTRRYGLEKLEKSGQSDAIRSAHAVYCEKELQSAEADWKVLATPQWMRRYSSLINDVRAAIQWSFDNERDADFAIRLSAKSTVLWAQLGLMNEQTKVVEQALARLPGSQHVGTRVEMELRISRGGALFHVRGYPADPEALEEFDRSAEIAESLSDMPTFIRATAGRASIWVSNARYAEAIDMALKLGIRFPQMSLGSFSRMLEHGYFFHGNLKLASEHVNGSLRDAEGSLRRTLNDGVGFDQRIISRAVLIFVKFLQGETSEAFGELDSALEEARALDYSISTCLLLFLTASPIAFLSGDQKRAGEYLDIAETLTKKHDLHRWSLWVAAYRSFISDGIQQPETEEIFRSAVGMRLEYLLVLAGVRAPLEALDRGIKGEGGWCRPELLRIKAKVLKESDPILAQSLVEASLDEARRMEAPFWELRAANTAYELAGPNQEIKARKMVKSALDKVDGAYLTADIAKAREILDLGDL
ncbi:LuxR family transcriptional regulator [Rhizobium ruizarguesonis]|uniref:ATP-binding protein n=1 Tax=Rhizobium ruizarguesonis TaxID=2081791 RepID=UPI00102F9883|nr:winged helix-turn-helix domain-containing protein [Rhizobium ruizarguesonis]TAV21325.1 LuxR family transcriptional regulator [Rhizobium ruizarguesonis]